MYRHLPGRNDEHTFGLQVIADHEDGVSGFCDRLLIGATTLTAESIVSRAKAATGDSLVIAAHVDRESFSLVGQLGFIPPSLALDAVEIAGDRAGIESRCPDCSRFPVVTGSDAHHPADIGKRFTWFTVENGSIPELKKALTCRDNRKAEC